MFERPIDGASLGSQVMSDEDRKELETQNEALVADLMKAAEESEDARKFLGTPTGQALRKFIVLTKQQRAADIANCRGDDKARQDLQYEYDVIIGVEQFFGQLLVAGEDALRHLQFKLGDEDGGE